MGSEHSSHSEGRERPVNKLTRGHTIPPPVPRDISGSINENIGGSGNTSPGTSLCSDSELPYISYTVNRPIGDSPKYSNRGGSARRGSLRGTTRANRANSARSHAHSIVIVKEAQLPQTTDKDEDLIRLQQIPMFLPIMRGTLTLPGARDPEVLEGLDSGPWLRLCARYQAHLAVSAQLVSQEQNIITIKCKEIDVEVVRLLTGMVERQRRGARLAEKLSQLRPMSQQLTRSHSLLNQALQLINDIDLLLPPEDRLEPFAWTTG